MKKYNHALTKGLTPENWKEKVILEALSTDDIVDLLADMRAMENFGKKLGGFFKEVLKARCPDMEEYDSVHFFVQFKTTERVGGLNTELIQEEMGEDWVEEHRKDGSEFVTIKLQAKE